MPIRYLLYFILNALLLASPVICNLFFSKTDTVSVAMDGNSDGNDISADDEQELEELGTVNHSLSFVGNKIQHWLIFYFHFEQSLQLFEIVPPPPRN